MKGLKNAISQIMLFFLGRGVKAGYSLDEEVKAELVALGDNYKVGLKASENGAAMLFWVEGGKIKTRVGKRARMTPANLDIVFKNIDSGFLVLTGQAGIANAYAEHRMLLYGDIYTAMSIVRVMAKLENYLFPSFMTNKILVKRPRKEVSSLRFYLKVALGL